MFSPKQTWAFFFFLIPQVIAGAPSVATQLNTAEPDTKTRAVQVSPGDALSLIARLIIAGRLDEAENVLQQVQNKTDDRVQEQFLEAQLAIRLDNPNRALEIYTAVLQQNPAQTRIRVERARLLAEMGNASAANAEFKALRQNVWSTTTLAYIDRYLSALRQRQPWTLQFTSSATYDTNASAGPDQDTVTLFGLPFVLSEDAQEQGAWGATVSALGSYRWALPGRLDFQFAGGMRHSDGEGSALDDSLISGQFGGVISGEAIAVSASVTANRRLFGGDGYSDAIGGQSVLDYRVDETFQVSGLLSVQSAKYDADKNRNGLVTSFTGRALKALNRERSVFVFAGVILEDARSKALENVTLRAGAAYIHSLSNGARVTLRPEVAYRDYDGIQPAFGMKRKDWRYSGAVEISAPSMSGSSLRPFVTYAYTRNASSIDFYSYDRHQIKLGLTMTL